jgi:alpha-beta hydrolase superfamily lysophospholipase
MRTTLVTLASLAVLLLSLPVARADGIDPYLDEWKARYKPLLQSTILRPGSEPELMDHGCVTGQAVVLVHGLAGSPHYMRALGRAFFEMGYTVLIPVLPGHGIKRPVALRDSKYADWIAEVEFSVNLARKLAKTVSLVGESIGAATSLQVALNSPDKINGALILFEPTLALPADKTLQQIGDKQLRAQNMLGRGFVPTPEMLEGTGANPYRYGKMFLGTSSQMAQLTRLMTRRYKSESARWTDVTQPLFLVHSVKNPIALIAESDRLAANHPNAKTTVEYLRLDATSNVEPTSHLLAEDIVWKKGKSEKILEPKNPGFDALVEKISTFTTRHLTSKTPGFCVK